MVTYSYSYCQRWVKFFDMVNSRRKSTACWEWSIVEHWPKNRWISWAEYQFLYQTTLFIWWLLLSCYAGQNGLAMKNVLNLCFSIHLIWKYHIKTNPLGWEWARGLFSYCHCAKVCGVRRAVTNIIFPQFSWVVKPFWLRAGCFKEILVLYISQEKTLSKNIRKPSKLYFATQTTNEASVTIAI